MAFLCSCVFSDRDDDVLQRMLETEEAFLRDLTHCLQHSHTDVSQTIKLAQVLRRIHLGASLATSAGLGVGVGALGCRMALASEQCVRLERSPLGNAPPAFADAFVRVASGHGDATSVLLYAPRTTSLKFLRAALRADVGGIRSMRFIDHAVCGANSSAYVALPWWASPETMKDVFLADSSNALHHDACEVIRLILSEPISVKNAL